MKNLKRRAFRAFPLLGGGALLIALLAFSLAACDTSGGGGDGGSSSTAVSEGQIQDLLKAIGSVYGTPDNSIAWDFTSGNWSYDDNGGLVYTVTWPESSADSPGIGVTLENLQALETSTKIVTASFSEAAWADAPTLGSTAAGKATLSITSANSGYYVPEALAKVTIIFDPNGKEWKRNPVTPTHVRDLLRSIGSIDATTGNWEFGGGDLNEDGDTFTVEWGGSYSPRPESTLESLKAMRTVSAGPVQVNLSDVDWKDSSPNGSTDAGKIDVTITLANDAQSGYELYEEGAASLTVTIVLDPKDAEWNDDYYIENSVYHVFTAQGLVAWNEIAQSARSTSCTLEADINLSDMAEAGANYYEWTPVGATSNSNYTGTFDGNNKTVTGLYVNHSSSGAGFFGFLGGTARNLTLKEPNVANSSDSVGGIAGQNQGTIENCHVDGGTITAQATQVGGIAGYQNGSNGTTITNCSNSATVTGNNSVGGIVGWNNNNGTVSNCTNTGNIVCSNSYVGQITGRGNYDDNCTAGGTVNAE